MVLNRSTGDISDSVFSRLPILLRKGDCLVLNDTRVFPARLSACRTDTGGSAELFLLKRLSDTDWKVLVRPGKYCRPGIAFDLAGGFTAVVLDGLGSGRAVVGFGPADRVHRLQSEIGAVPLPPYIKRAPDSIDKDRYQTVYARNGSAVAAPTAGLHFTVEMLSTLAEAGVNHCHLTLNVGPGTFEPLRNERLADNSLDPEEYSVPSGTLALLSETRRAGGRIVAVGTTAARVLESIRITETGPLCGETSLFIFPPRVFENVDALITNFHLPGSSLIALVAAFAGLDPVMNAYRTAVARGYRFYSYGDAMIVV
jgi:S-adenosylmethionine:tRNA ribosyltransferase-isomerase